MKIKNLAMALLAIFAISAKTSEAGLFGPSDYEECAKNAAEKARSNQALRILLNGCETDFPARRSATGGYKYYDSVSEQIIQVSGPQLSVADKKKIDEIRRIAANARVESVRRAAEDEAVKRKRHADTLSKLKINSSRVECASQYFCGEKIVSINVTNASGYTINMLSVGWVIARGLTSCGQLEPKELKYINIPSGRTATLTFNTFDGPTDDGWKYCVGVTDLNIL